MLRIPREMERYRVVLPGPGGDGNRQNGMLEIPHLLLRIVVSDGEGWDHVSVSHRDRTPTWEEMEAIKRMLFSPEDCVMQLHPPLANYKNDHPHVLHMWRPHNQVIPQPPRDMV
jgi:hypothetical protein